MHETVESTAVVDGSLDRVKIIIPDDFAMPPGGLNIRLGDSILGQEARLHDFKRDAMLAFVRANKINRMICSGGRNPKIGVITVGKSYLDVRQALDELGLDEVKCNDLGMRLYKIGCPWPISRLELMEFAQGLDLIIVVEEKRSLIEVQVREELYGTANQPVCIGKKDERGNWLFPVKGALDPNDVAICIGERLLNYAKNDQLAAEVARLKEAQRILAETEDVAVRIPYFCSGCPHNTSTVVPAGSRAYAGIGCHYMAQWMDRSTSGYTQMGAEGTNWIGEAPFSTRSHVFQNLGDGTYNHSGSLAIRSAIQSGVNITYKILFNDAVAMTGGQHNDGDITVPQIANEMAAEGAKRVVIVTDEPGKYPSGTKWPAGVTTHHRDDLQEVQKELAQVPGCTVLIYDQTCAAEKRRRRKRGQYPDPDKRVVINELVCEGCGDCGVKSNCVSVQPLETEFGRKRTIDQSSCNKDFSCLKGFCPSFVTVEGAKLKRGRGVDLPADTAALASPALPAIDGTYDVIVTGVGGTGIVTIGAILGMAAHLEGKGVGIIDMAGLAQKGGAVASHLRFANRPEDIHAIRVAAHSAELVLGGDIVVAGNKKVLAAVKPGSTAMIINLAEMLPGEFTRNPEFSLPSERLKRTITSLAGPANTHFINASALATALLGQSIGANMFMLGYAYQLGTLPISAEALEKAIEMNGEAVAMNHAAFRWGRRAAVDLAGVEALARPAAVDPARQLSASFDEMVVRRVEFLAAYQNAAYADRYRRRVAAAKAAEAAQAPGKSGFAEAVARYLFKLMAYKDEYEVARLYSDPAFLRQVSNEVDGDNLRLTFHLAPPLLARRNKATGEPRKMTFGPWMMSVFRPLAKLKFLRGTAFDPFGYTAERRTERQLVRDYEALLDELIARLSPDNHHLAVGLAAIPEKIRGFGPVKMRHLTAAKADEAALLDQFRAGPMALLKAAE
jgi:indolepyruvate ferredoxin oxidoreductase